MGSAAAEFGSAVAESEGLKSSSNVKVHSLMCLELNKFIQRISHILPDIDSARPRCASELQMFCTLHVTLDKANLLVRLCCESSKFYLVVTSERILMRFERVQNTLESCLSHIQHVVPPSLAAMISGIGHDLRNTKFTLEPSEEEAGKVMLALFRRDITTSSSENQVELTALQLAALRLNITSAKEVVIEKRLIKRQLEKVNGTDSTKSKVLKYLLYLMRKYGESVWKQEALPKSAPNKAQVHDLSTLEPPEEFKCPLSMKLMYDPVVIDSGKTFERSWIEKWFSKGHIICPLTHMRLKNLSLVPNVAIKGLISKWCLKNGVTVSEPKPPPPPASACRASSSMSVFSFGSSIDNLCLQTSHVSLHSTDTDRSADPAYNNNIDKFIPLQPRMKAVSVRYKSSTERSSSVLASLSQLATERSSSVLASLSQLAMRPWGSQCDAVENVKKQLDENYLLFFPNSLTKPLIKFLKDAHDRSDVKAQKHGADVLLAILSSSRFDVPALQEDEVFLLVSLLDSAITEKALPTIEVLSNHEDCKSGLIASGVIPPLLKLLDTKFWEIKELAVRILSNLSHNTDIVNHIVFLDCIPMLVRLSEDPILANNSIKIIKVLCKSDETITKVAETGVCITHIVKVLETGTKEDQEDIVEILFSLCNTSAEYCQLTMTENIIQSLVDVSVNGTSRAQETAKQLLMLLEHSREINASECSDSDNGRVSSRENSSNSAGSRKDVKKSPKSFGFLGKKVSRFLHGKH